MTRKLHKKMGKNACQKKPYIYIGKKTKGLQDSTHFKYNQ